MRMMWLQINEKTDTNYVGSALKLLCFFIDFTYIFLGGKRDDSSDAQQM